MLEWQVSESTVVSNPEAVDIDVFLVQHEGWSELEDYGRRLAVGNWGLGMELWNLG